MPHSNKSASPRCAALVGPYLSGKTTLLEALLFATGSVSRKGSVKDGNTVGDHAPEARTRQMSVEIGLASTEYLGERWNLLDCPGSVELSYETQCALMAADVAVVVCEPIIDKVPTLAPLLRFLDDYCIPHMLYINKVDTLGGLDVRIRDLMQAFQAISSRRLVLRQVPIREGEKISGYVDLVSERAYHYNPHAPSDLIRLPESLREYEQQARLGLLETLADFDDSLLEQLLEDVAPAKDEVYRQLSKDLASDLIVPVFLGSAENDGGVRRLLKALRHEVPEVGATATRLGILPDGDSKPAVVAQVFKTYIAPHAGRLSFARIWQGTVTDGMTLGETRVGGIYRMLGQQQTKLSQASAGEVVALARMEGVATGDLLTDKGPKTRSDTWPPAPPAVYALAIHAENRNDEVKLTSAVQKLAEEDPSLSLELNPDTNELVLSGQGDIHLQLAVDRLRNKYNVSVKTRRPQVPYKETIRRPLMGHHSRFKRQTGGHGQFADITIDVKPQPRGEGFLFTDLVVGGAVPRQYIPAVETGVRESMGQGPLGFPLVDFSVTLTGGQYHSVDSSEMAFKTVARQAITEALPKCDPVLLEPILTVTISVPSDSTSKVHGMISSRRGQILGFDAKAGWDGWDEVKAYIPQSEVGDLIVELRSLTMGVGTYVFAFDRLAELTGRLADKAIEQHLALKAAS